MIWEKGDMELILTEYEKRRLVIVAENVLNSGHWGNAAVEIPEEKMLFDAVRNAGEKMDLTLPQVEMLFRWFLGSTDYGNILLPEDVSIIEKIAFALYKHYEDKKLAYMQELNRIAGVLNSSADVLSRADLKRSLDHIAELARIEQEGIYRELKKRINPEESAGEADADAKDGPISLEKPGEMDGQG